MDKIFWVFKTKLANLNQPKLIVSPLTREFHVTIVNAIDKVEVKYHFINHDELYEWLDMLQGNGDPDLSMKKLLKKRNKAESMPTISERRSGG